MPECLIEILTVSAAYLAGSIPFGLLIGKLNGIDVRQCGSCNIGATNVTRTVGPAWGKVCFLLDALKGFLPVFLMTWLVSHGPESLSGAHWLPAAAAAAAVCGHLFPVWLKFKGGKGVSTIIGTVLALSPWATLAAVAAWVIIFFIFRYVSLASLVLAFVLPCADVLFGYTGFQSFNTGNFVLLCMLSGLTIVKHRSNIKRLLNGTENRFDKKKEA